MTEFHATFLHNTYGYEGYTKVPKATPIPKGLLTKANRGFALSPDLWWNEDPEKIDWTIPDAWVHENHKQGLMPLAVLANIPKEWREAGHIVCCFTFEEAAKTLIERYGSLVAYQFGNEFDTKGNFGYQETGLFMGCWNACRYILQRYHPLALGGITSIGQRGEGFQYLNQIIKGMNESPDIVAIHLYPQQTTYGIGDLHNLIFEFHGAVTGAGAPNARRIVSEFGWVPQHMVRFPDLNGSLQGSVLRQMMRVIQRTGIIGEAHFWNFDTTDGDNGFGFKDQKAGAKIWNREVQRIAREG